MLLEGKLPAGCAMHPDLSFDGKRVVFAFADHTPSRELRQFFLYEIQVDGTGLRQITLGPAPTMGTVANIPLWLCFVVSAGFAVFGMNMALRAFKKAIK